MEIANDETVTVTEEVDGGVQTVSAKLPMIVTTDLRYEAMLGVWGLISGLTSRDMRLYRIS